jgi:hypothetical protein
MYGAIICAIAALAYASWIAYNYLHQPLNVPILTAKSGPFKVKPKIAQTIIEDNHSYNALYNGYTQSRSLQFLPEPEQSLKVANHEVDIIGDIIDNIKQEESRADANNKVKSESKLLITTDSTMPSFVATAKDKTFSLQLGAFASETLASQQFSLLKQKYPKIIQDYVHSIKVVTKGSSSIYYLLLVGIDSSSEAYATCKKLIHNKQNCIVTK